MIIVLSLPFIGEPRDPHFVFSQDQRNWTSLCSAARNPWTSLPDLSHPDPVAWEPRAMDSNTASLRPSLSNRKREQIPTYPVENLPPRGRLSQGCCLIIRVVIVIITIIIIIIIITVAIVPNYNE
uniref:Uncharacterized protein n=1 Tax=Pipistrellus kuhlii TaxID=59472 RepID=A0A7J7ZJG4_PIPKU|nr:hypothetical protein mPipKuh1_009636 [Pipistrellus kuhlii]